MPPERISDHFLPMPIDNPDKCSWWLPLNWVTAITIPMEVSLWCHPLEDFIPIHLLLACVIHQLIKVCTSYRLVKFTLNQLSMMLIILDHETQFCFWLYAHHVDLPFNSNLYAKGEFVKQELSDRAVRDTVIINPATSGKYNSRSISCLRITLVSDQLYFYRRFVCNQNALQPLSTLMGLDLARKPRERSTDRFRSRYPQQVKRQLSESCVHQWPE